MADSDDINPGNSGSQAAKGGPWNMIAIVVFVTVIAILLVPGDEEDPIEELPPVAPPAGQSLLPPGSEQTADPADAQTPDAAESSESGQQQLAEQLDAEPAENVPATPLAPGGAARALIAELRTQSPLDLDRAFAAAGQHLANGQLDDAYLLYFFAAREGHGPSAMTLARHADPSHHQPGGLFAHADEIQAYKWYSQAQQAGVEQATPALSALYQRVEDAANGGNDQARRILLQWK